MMQEMDWSCWSCSWKVIGGNRFPLNCSYPAPNNPSRDKPVPGTVVDQGCKFFDPKQKG